MLLRLLLPYTTAYLCAPLLVGVLVLDTVHLETMGLERAALRE